MNHYAVSDVCLNGGRTTASIHYRHTPKHGGHTWHAHCLVSLSFGDFSKDTTARVN